MPNLPQALMLEEDYANPTPHGAGIAWACLLMALCWLALWHMV